MSLGNENLCFWAREFIWNIGTPSAFRRLREKTCVCVCVCERERERERESVHVYTCAWESERGGAFNQCQLHLGESQQRMHFLILILAKNDQHNFWAWLIEVGKKKTNISCKSELPVGRQVGEPHLGRFRGRPNSKWAEVQTHFSCFKPSY